MSPFPANSIKARRSTDLQYRPDIRPHAPFRRDQASTCQTGRRPYKGDYDPQSGPSAHRSSSLKSYRPSHETCRSRSHGCCGKIVYILALVKDWFVTQNEAAACQPPLAWSSTLYTLLTPLQ